MKYWNKSRNKVMKHWHSVSVDDADSESVKIYLQRLPLEGKFYIKLGAVSQEWTSAGWRYRQLVVVYFQEQKHAALFRLKWS